MQWPPEQVEKASIAMVEFSICDFFHAEVLGFMDQLSVTCSGETPAGRKQPGYGRYACPSDTFFEKLSAGDRFNDHLTLLSSGKLMDMETPLNAAFAFDIFEKPDTTNRKDQ